MQQTGGGTSQRFFLFLARSTGMSAANGALSQLRAATDPAAKGGEFYGPLFVNSGPPVRKPVVRRLGMDKAIAALWEVSDARDRNRDRRARRSGGMTVPPMDRAAAVRGALRTLVARNGFHGASMSAVASQAGVATGTAYTHYASKDELVLAAYLETKAQLAQAAMAGLAAGARAAAQFRSIWLATYRHLQANPDHARFLLQVDHSPYRSAAHQAAMAGGDPLMAQAAKPDIAARLLPLPLEVIYELGLSPAVRLAASGIELTGEQLGEIADACWRAISQPETTLSATLTWLPA